MTPGNASGQYVLNRVQAASPIELIRILHEMALQAVDEALAALQAGDIPGRGQAITKAIEILSELRFALRRDVHPQYCDTLAGLYGYIQSQLIRAHSEKSASPLEEVSRLIGTLLEGWTGAINNLNAQPVRGSAAQPVPGLTAPPNELVPIPSAENPYSIGPASEMARSRSWQL